MKIVAATLFVATYACLLAFPKIRAYIALGSASIFVFLGIMPFGRLYSAIDWNVLMMIAGTMGIVSLFIESRMPARLADVIIERTPNVKWTIIALSLFAGVVSAFIDNVATVLMIAPIALDIARKLGISPVHGVIAIAISSNLQGAATLVGDTTAIMLGGYAHLTFADFFLFQGKPGLFWVVQAGMLAATAILLYLFRRETQPITIKGGTVVKDYFPAGLLVGMVTMLIVASFIPNTPRTTNGIICLTLLGVGLIVQFIRFKQRRVVTETLAEINYFTIMLLAGLFVVVGGMSEVGLVDDISRFFVTLSSGNVFAIYTLLVAVSVILSAFIDNIPYVATMLPVVAGIATSLGMEPHVLYFGLLSGATLGGNLTPVGASANITALGILQRQGHDVATGQFMKIGVPFTLTAVTVGYILIWMLWRP